jgi:hypothetical protein
MATATTPRVSRETLEDRLRMARTTTMRYDDGYGVTTNGASRRIGRGIEKLVNHIIEDGIEYDDEKDALSEFLNAILIDIDRQIIDFADKIENEVRAARWENVKAAAER